MIDGQKRTTYNKHGEIPRYSFPINKKMTLIRFINERWYSDIIYLVIIKGTHDQFYRQGVKSGTFFSCTLLFFNVLLWMKLELCFPSLDLLTDTEKMATDPSLARERKSHLINTANNKIDTEMAATLICHSSVGGSDWLTVICQKKSGKREINAFSSWDFDFREYSRCLH